jgi:hypothetical protein
MYQKLVYVTVFLVSMSSAILCYNHLTKGEEAREPKVVACHRRAVILGSLCNKIARRWQRTGETERTGMLSAIASIA